MTHLDFVPLPESINQYHTQFLTHNRVPVTPHRTPNLVPISTMHSHPCHAMSSCTCNAIMLIAYIYNHPCTHIHAYLSMLHISHCMLSAQAIYNTYQHVIFHTACYQLKPYTAHINMSYSTMHVINSSHIHTN